MNDPAPDSSSRTARTLSGRVGYALAVAAVAAATAVRSALDPVLGDNYPFSTYFGAVAVVAWWVRTRPSVAALLLSGVVSLYLFLPPRHSFAVTEPGVLAGLILFLAVGGVMVAMGHARRVALRKAERLLAEAVARRDEARKAADAEAEQREQLRTTLAGIGDAVISTDRAGNVTYLNPVAESLTGWTNGEAAGEPLTRVFRVVTEATRQPVENPAVRALAGGVVAGLADHSVLISKDGTERPIDDSAAPIRCRAGEVVGCVLVFRDVSGRRQAERERERGEAAVRASEARLRLAADAVNGIIYECDLRTGHVERTRGLYEVLGHRPDEVPPTQAWWADQIHPDDRDRVLRPDPAVVRPDAAPVEYRVRHRDGRWLHVEDRGVVLRDAAGQPVRLVGCTTDVTERKEAEERLRASEQQLRLALDASAAGTWRWDADAGTSWDDQFHAMYGLPAGGPRGLDGWLRSIHPDDRGRVQARVRAVLETPGEDDWREEFRAVHPAGERWMYGLGRGVRDAAGRLVRMAGLNLDVTERKAAEEAVREARSRLESTLAAGEVGTWEFDVARDAVRADRNLARMFGMAGGEGEDRPLDRFTRVIHPDDRERVVGAIGRALEAGDGYESDFRLVGPDGAVRWVVARGRVERDRAGRAVRLPGVVVDITGQRKAEEAVRAGEEKYRTLFESMDEGFCVIEFLDGPHGPLSDYVHVEANPAYTANAGIPDIVGRKVREMVPAEADGWVQIYRDVLVTGRPVRFERELVATGRHLDLAAFRIGPPERRQVAVLFKDITARKRAEGRLRESEERLRLALDAAGMGTWEWAVATGEVKWGDKTREVFAVAADTPLTFALFESRLHPDDVGPNRRKTDESLRTGEYENEYRVPLPGGGVRWVATRGRMLRDAAGRNARMLGVVADVTGRKAAEAERAAAERTLAALVERCPFGIYIVDADFRIANVNAGSQTGAFANVRPLIGRPFGEAMRIIWPEPVAAEVIGRFRHTLATGEPYRSTDFVNPRADIAQTEGYEWELHRLALPDGRAGVVCYYYDSTRLRRVEQALRDADRRKDVFLATLAHELRNPLAPLRNGLQVIRLAGAGGTVEQARSMMDRQLTQLVRLVDDLLDISRVTSGKLELRRERVELRAVIDAAVETSRPAVEQAGHELAVAVDEEPVFVDGDLTRLAQVVSNLLTNSAKYTHRGGHVRLTARREGGAAVVSVADDGIGIPPAMLDRVFQMFVQVDRTLEKTTGGLGIGLSLVKGLVEMHGGTIEARSEGEGKGSEFVVRLPVVTPDAGGADRAGGRAEEAVPSGPRRVLVVDDNADAADSLAQLLELLGNEVRTAGDGEAGVAAAAAFRPAVVLMDIGMPRVNGYEAARRIRAEAWGRGVVLVALTGWGQEDDRRKSAEAGFDHHLVKPVEYAALTGLLAGLPPATA